MGCGLLFFFFFFPALSCGCHSGSYGWWSGVVVEVSVAGGYRFFFYGFFFLMICLYYFK